MCKDLGVSNIFELILPGGPWMYTEWSPSQLLQQNYMKECKKAKLDLRKEEKVDSFSHSFKDQNIDKPLAG